MNWWVSPLNTSSSMFRGRKLILWLVKLVVNIAVYGTIHFLSERLNGGEIVAAMGGGGGGWIYGHVPIHVPLGVG